MSFEVAVERRLGEASLSVSFTSDALITAVVGPSGAGKTSLLTMIAGLLRPASGRIVVGGHTLFDAEVGIDLPPESRRVGYVFQEPRLFPHRTVRANLLFGARLAGSRRRVMAFDDAVALLGLEGLLARRPPTLSGGEARRVAIGRALLSAPEFLLLDEPLTSLDRARREELLPMIERIRDEYALPMLFVSHQEAEVSRLAGAVVRLDVAEA